VSAAVWTTTLLTAWDKRLVATIRSQRLYTTYRKMKCGKQPPPGEARPVATCPYCLQGVDDTYHALNTCSASHAHKERVLRHDNAVCKKAAAAMQGEHAGRLLLWDARGTGRSAPRAPGATKLPECIIPHHQQHSIPDICQTSLPADFAGPRVTPEQRRTGVITIVEIKYAPDPDIQLTIRQQAIKQHSALKISLEARGWGSVTIYPVIIGNAGTVTATSHAALHALGVDSAARTSLLRALAIDSVRRTTQIWKPRLAKSVGQQPQPVPVPTQRSPSSSQPPGADSERAEPDRQSSPSVLSRDASPNPSEPDSCPQDSEDGTASRSHDTRNPKRGRDPRPAAVLIAGQVVACARTRPWQEQSSPSRLLTEMAVPEQARPTKRRQVSYPVLADLPEDGNVTPPAVSAVAVDTPTADRLESLGVSAVDTGPVGESSVGVPVDLTAQRTGKAPAPWDPVVRDGRPRLRSRRQPPGPSLRPLRRCRRRQSLVSEQRVSAHSTLADQLQRGAERKCTQLAPKRKRAASDPASALSGRPAVRQRVLPIRACRDTVLVLERMEWVPRRMIPSGAESGIPFDPG
jgi:hypothetical protein